LSSTAIVGRRDGLIEAGLDDEIVLLNVENGCCYGLNRVGSRMWELLANPTRVQDLCKVLLTEYEVDPKVCERQVIDLLEELRVEGLIETLQAT
jgi:hypothetical protein